MGPELRFVSGRWEFLLYGIAEVWNPKKKENGCGRTKT